MKVKQIYRAFFALSLTIAAGNVYSDDIYMAIDYFKPISTEVGIQSLNVSAEGRLTIQFLRVQELRIIQEKHTADGKFQFIADTGKTTIEATKITKPLSLVISSAKGIEKSLSIDVDPRTQVGIVDLDKIIMKSEKNHGRFKVQCTNCDGANLISNHQLDGQLVTLKKEWIIEESISSLKDKLLAHKKQELQIAMEQEKARATIIAQEKIEAKKRMEIEKIKLTQGDGSSDDLTCKSFGFKPQTSGYSDCRLKLEVASRQARQQQAQYDEQKRQYDEQKRQHDAQLAEQKRQRQVGAGLALMQMGSGLLAPPAPPPPASQTIVTPSGRIVNCHTTGTVTNCF
jgi:hypothetical protein